ncbi:MAG: VWA domain-containing protein [Acidobacteriota bacterium]
MATFKLTRLTLTVALVVMVAASFSAPAAGAKRASDLPEKWRVWLEEEVYPLISSEQRKAFLQLETDAQRQEFAERLWAIWGSQLGFGTAFRRQYDERLEMARNEFGNTTEDRSRVLLLHGPPDVKKEIECTEVFNPIEIWRYVRIEGLGDSVTILFYKPYGLGRFRLWEPFETRSVLYSTPGQQKLGRPMMSQVDRPEWGCGDANEILGLIAMAEYWLKDPKAKALMTHAPEQGSAGVESASSRFLQFTTLLPKDAAPLSFTIEATPGQRRGAKVRTSLTVKVAREGLGTTTVGDSSVIQLDASGELSTGDSMADRFRYAYTFPATSEELVIVAERDLRPGKYRLRLKIEDSNSKLAGVQETVFDVPVPELEPESAAEKEGAATVERLANSPATVLSLTGPEGEGITGVQRFTALTSPLVGRVEFLLDGKPVLTKNRPPFEVELDIGPFPRLATITAVAYDARGSEIDRKQSSINVGRERFLVKLQPVGSGDRSGGRVRAHVEVNVPTDRKLEKLEVFWNETLTATLYGEPFDAWVPIQDSTEIGYLRALATLADGGEAEDVQFVNAPQFLAGVEVDTVELPVTVLDDKGKPVEGLGGEDFEVAEDGVAQTVSHFSLQRDLAIRVALVIDTSGSMEKTLPEVQRVVMGSLRNLLRPRDRACVVAFSDKPALVEGFTADFGSLERALITLRAERETALFDATIYGLFQFSGMRGRKAMIVLTDGEDNASRMDLERTLDFAQRAGVTIYTIGIDLPITKVKARSFLTRIARASGGEAFFLPRDAALGPVYDQINRELRTQYLLAYTSTSEAPRDRFRKVAVKLRKPDLELRTIAGYYPGD